MVHARAERGRWRCSTFGHDSQAGTIIHEMAHEVDNRIDDKEELGHGAYGIENVLFYAKYLPWTAVCNAENYGYFAEACE